MLRGRVGLGETLLAPRNGINRIPRSRKAEKKHHRRAGCLRLVRKWATCREERVVRGQ